MKKALIALFVVVIVLCTFAGWGLKMVMGKPKTTDAGKYATVEKGEILSQVVETGTIDAVKSVEVKSRVSGRVAKLLVDEGDFVKQGQLIAVIDPKETQLQVDQDAAQLRGAQSAVARAEIEMQQRKVSARASYVQAQARLDQLREELRAQPTLTKSSVSQASSALVSAKKELERLRSSAQPNERTASETAVREAEANYANAKADFDRQVELERKGYVPHRAVENAQLSLDLAKARLDSANASHERLQSQQALELAKAEEEVYRLQAGLDSALANRIQDKVKRKEFESAVAALDQARASLRDVEALRKSKDQSQATVQQLASLLRNSMRNLGETEIRAPITGVVTQKLVQEGELVASLNAFSAGTPVVRVEVRDAMRVKLSINEIDVAKLRIGMPANIDVDAIPDHKLSGRVSKIAPASTTTGATTQMSNAGGEPVVKYSVEVRLLDSEPRLKSGMSAKCTMITMSRKNVLRLPLEFVGKDKDGSRFVMIAPPSKTPEANPTKQKVTVGATSGAFVELVTGAKVGDKVAKPDFTGPARKGAVQFGPDRQDDQQGGETKKQ